MTTQTKKLSDEELAAIEKRCAEATPGPWELGNENNEHAEIVTGPVVVSLTRHGHLPPDYEKLLIEREEMLANVAFIISARSDVPALLSALREAREELARVRGLLETGFSEREAAEIAMRYQRECMDAAQCRIPGPPDLPGVIRVVREARAALKGGG